jgi:hypothetical protein
MALAMMLLISAAPLSAAVASSSRTSARTPGKKDRAVDITTPVSPSDGSTCSMYRRKTALGPITITPLETSRARWA